MSLQVKSYYAASVQAAMLRARQELGSDALLLHSRMATPEHRHFGEYEVTFGVGDFEGPSFPPPPGASAPEPPVKRVQVEPDASALRQEVSDMRQEMSRIAAAMSRPGWSLGDGWTRPELTVLQQELTAQELDADWTRQVLQQVEQQAKPEWVTSVVREKVEQALGSELMVSATLGLTEEERQVIAFVGPSGAGKTTALVKLAARYGLTSRSPLQILTMDVDRVAATHQLHSYAAILGASFQVVDGEKGLAQALEASRNRQFVFIDTPGFGGNELAEAQEVARTLKGVTGVQIHLVVPAPYRRRDLTAAIDRFEMFEPHRLLFTRMDETGTIGPLLNESRRTQLPISFLSHGQLVPEDIMPASADYLLNRLFGRTAASAAVAA